MFALPVFKLTFRISVPWLALEYRPWRLLMQIISLPGILGVLGLLMLEESPKFLLSKGRSEDAMEALKCMYSGNCGAKKEDFPVRPLFIYFY